MVNVNDFNGISDSDRIEKAIFRKTSDGIIIIPPRESADEPQRRYWLLDRAVLLPENTTLILQNCTIKLSDKCRDNFFRTANCGLGISDPEKIHNVHILGIGSPELIGADHPRSTGDESKILANPAPHLTEDLCRLADWIPEEHKSIGQLDFFDVHIHTYGTDAGNPNESQYGDWRNIGILFANTENFSIKNIKITEPHAWSISLEACSYGTVEEIRFSARMSKNIDGMIQHIENQDGLNLRNGCHNITVNNIKGETGDDVIALTAIADKTPRPGGSLKYTHVMHNDWSRRESGIHDITVSNVTAQSYMCLMVRLLACETMIENIVINDVIDTSETGKGNHAAIGIGENDSSYGRCLPGSIRNISVSNLICSSDTAVFVGGYLTDSTLTNIINKNDNGRIIVAEREHGLKNVNINNSIGW